MAIPEMRTSPWIKVRNSKIHGKGVFAAKRIPKGTRVIEYLGDRISHAEADARYEDHDPNDNHTFLFIVDKKTVIDAGVKGNAARFINHSCDGNCESVIEQSRVFIETTRVVEPVMRYGITQRRYSPRAAVASKKTFSGPDAVRSSMSRMPSQMRIIGRRKEMFVPHGGVTWRSTSPARSQVRVKRRAPVPTQLPFTQVCPVVHALLQEPQWAELVWRLTHDEPHWVCGGEQVPIPTQVPLMHAVVAGQGAGLVVATSDATEGNSHCGNAESIRSPTSGTSTLTPFGT